MLYIIALPLIGSGAGRCFVGVVEFDLLLAGGPADAALVAGGGRGAPAWPCSHASHDGGGGCSGRGIGGGFEAPRAAGG